MRRQPEGAGDHSGAGITINTERERGQEETDMRKQIICLGLAAVLALGMAALTGCGKKESKQATTAVTTTTEEPTEATTTEEPTQAQTYKTMYLSKLEALIDEGGVNGGKLVDLDADGTPEMIIFRGSAPSFQAEIFTIADGQVTSIYEKTFTGLRYWQSDASYEVWINESISPAAVVLFDADDEWTEDVVYAVSVSDGATSTQELKAVADGEPDTPDWSECDCSINGKSVSASDYEVARDRLSTGSKTVNPASADLDGLKAELSE